MLRKGDAISTVERLAEENGITILTRADPAQFNPMTKDRWSLAMIIAWVTHRTAAAVTLRMNEYCQATECYWSTDYGKPFALSGLRMDMARETGGVSIEVQRMPEPAFFNFDDWSPQENTAYGEITSVFRRGDIVPRGNQYRSINGSKETTHKPDEAVYPFLWNYLADGIDADGAPILWADRDGETITYRGVYCSRVDVLTMWGEKRAGTVPARREETLEASYDAALEKCFPLGLTGYKPANINTMMWKYMGDHNYQRGASEEAHKKQVFYARRRAAQRLTKLA
jgi:hypothetical protein